LNQYFVGLNRRQTMTLVSALTYGGQQSIGIFEHLPEQEAELLRQRALKILELPRKQRVSLLVREMKRLLTARREDVWTADPEHLARVLRTERPALVEVALRALPAEVAAAVRRRLPPAAPPRLVREVKPQILQIVQWKLEQALVHSRGSSRTPALPTGRRGPQGRSS
jgi:flagellar motor switch protein FliG